LNGHFTLKYGFLLARLGVWRLYDVAFRSCHMNLNTDTPILSATTRSPGTLTSNSFVRTFAGVSWKRTFRSNNDGMVENSDFPCILLLYLPSIQRQWHAKNIIWHVVPRSPFTGPKINDLV